MPNNNIDIVILEMIEKLKEFIEYSMVCSENAPIQDLWKSKDNPIILWIKLLNAYIHVTQHNSSNESDLTLPTELDLEILDDYVKRHKKNAQRK